MKIRYQDGDLMRAKQQIIIHGCNAQGVMGSGVARAVRDTYPKAYTDYIDHHAEKGLRLGEVVWSPQPNNLVIGNAITQEFYGRENIRYCSYEAIALAMEEINFVAEALPIGSREVAMPLIGAGLANGDWRIISNIIEVSATSFTPVVYLLDGIIPHSNAI